MEARTPPEFTMPKSALSFLRRGRGNKASQIGLHITDRLMFPIRRSSVEAIFTPSSASPFPEYSEGRVQLGIL